MNDWADILIQENEQEWQRILETWWSWLLPGQYEPVLVTAFGDWFLTDESGRVHFLDLLEGALFPAAESLESLRTLMEEQEKRDQWFLPGFVIAMQNAGMPRLPGYCYGDKMHPIIGGKIEVQYLWVVYFEVWQSICGQLHEQVRKLPPGTRIRGLEHRGGWELRLLTDHEGGDG